MRGVEGEQFAAGFGDSTEFVVLEMRRSRPLVGAVGQVAGAVNASGCNAAVYNLVHILSLFRYRFVIAQ